MDNAVATVPYMVVRGDGNVGIGTTAPTMATHIKGANTLPDASGNAANDGVLRLGAAGTNAILDMGVDNSIGLSWLQSRNEVNYTTNYPLVLNPNGGRVGIGTVGPVKTLSIGQQTAGNNLDYAAEILRHGTLAAPGTWTSGVSALLVSDIATDGPAALDTTGLVQINADRIGDADVNAANALLFQVSNDNGSALAVNGKRNVGIGTTSPAVKLDVYAAGGASAFQQVAAFESTRAGATDGTYLGIYDNTGGVRHTNSNIASVNGNLALQTTSGAVGIGTTAPGGFKLNVLAPDSAALALGNDATAANGNTVYTYLRAKDSTQTLTNVAYQGGVIADTTDGAEKGNYVIGVLNSAAWLEALRILNNGNVGIGTTNPKANFEVNGNMRLAPQPTDPPLASQVDGMMWMRL